MEKHQLSLILANRRVERVTSELRSGSVSERSHLKWFLHLRNAAAGKWLECLPTQPGFSLTSNEFRVALQLRMFLPVAGFIPGTHCNCTFNNRHPPLDELGHHLAHNCPKRKTAGNTHDEVKITLVELMKYCGYNCRLEPAFFFTDCDKRPDIVDLHEVGHCRGTAYDLTCCTTLKRTALPQGSLKPPKRCELLLSGEGCGASSTAGNKEKVKKYKDICEQERFSFKALTFESSGFIDSDFLALLKRMAASCSDVKKIPHDTLYNYFLKKISMKIQGSLARNVIGSSFILSGNASHTDRSAVSDHLVLASRQ